MDEVHAFAQEYRPALGERIWQWLGFGTCHAPHFDEIPDDDPSWAPGRMITKTYVRFDWPDRLRILISGKIMVEIAHKTSVTVPAAMSKSAVSVLSPLHKLRHM